MRRAALGTLLALLGGTVTARVPTASLALRSSFGGAVLAGRITAGGTDELTGVWSAGGRARLLKCIPRCETVQTVPVKGTLPLGTDTPYRVVLSGDFRTGQRVKLALRFRNMQVLNVDATVTRP